MRTHLTRAQQRAHQYWFVDGLAEIAAGIVSLLLAVLFGIWPLLTKSPWSLLLFMAFATAVSGGLRLFITKIKEKSTYPRTGYVSPPTGLENKRLLAAAVAATLLLLAVNLIITLQWPTSAAWIPMAAGLIFAFVFAFTAYLAGLRRFYGLALLSLLVGIGLGLLGSGFLEGAAALTALVGFCLLFLGIRTRQAYIHQNPALSE